VAMMPGLQQILAMIDGNPIKPGSKARIAPELGQLPEGLQEHVMRRIFGLGWISQ
jgi:hypothetical protein